MRIRKDHTYTTIVFSVEDGPVEDSTPGYRTQSQFKVDYLAASYIGDELQQVYLKGPQVKSNGELGKSVRARRFFGDYPAWVTDFLEWGRNLP